MSPRQKRAALQAILLGLAATVAVIALSASGWIDWLEHRTLDLRFRYTNSIRESPDLVCIDIDDASLVKIGRWPWPRDEQAALLAIPAELGARAILVDLNWVEPQPLRLDLIQNLDLLEDPLDSLGHPQPMRLPDEELRLAIESAGNVYLAVVYDPDAWEQSRDFRTTLEALRAGPATTDELERRLGVSERRAADLLNAARVVLALEQDIQLDSVSAAERAGVDPRFVTEVFERCRFFALREFVQRRLNETPDLRTAPTLEACAQLYGELTGRNFENDTPQKFALLTVFRERLGYEATVRDPPAPHDRVAAIAAEADAVVPVYFPFARAARRCGFVKFEPDSDGVMRRNALFAVHRGNVLGQLAFVLACDELGVGPDDIDVSPGQVTLRPQLPDARPLTLQLDRAGRTVVPWVPQPKWEQQFGQHVPADAVVQVYDRRRQVEENERKLQVDRAAYFGGAFFDDPAEYRALFDEWYAVQADVLLARYRGTAADVTQAQSALAQIEADLSDCEGRLICTSAAELARWRFEPFAASALPRISDLEFRLDQLPALADLGNELRLANAALREEIARTLAWLRPRLENKICLIGYTATALADMTPIPTNARAPGVIAHANLLSGLLTGRTVTWTTGFENALLALWAGAAVTGASAFHRPRTALLIAAALFLALCGAAAFVFYYWTLWLVVTPALLAIIASYAIIAFYRYIFIDRERRQLATSLSQYTSSALARQMAENAELCKRAETREVTAMFTDFAGFTSMSEQIGAERTQRVLNLSLGRISDVMLRHEAMINKFIGDGVFAFWNPVIYPQADHAQRACATAVELLVGLADLIAEQASAGGDRTFAALHIRIGVASGRAVVGPCGSEQKYDYTCIGDSVNVASRLESANKFFDTQILTHDVTRGHLNGEFAFRELGHVRVKGRQQPVGVFELLGRTAGLAAAALEYAALFSTAVRLFQEKRWADARVAFERCCLQRPEDLAAVFYAKTAAIYANNPPPADEWAGTIELTEK